MVTQQGVDKSSGYFPLHCQRSDMALCGHRAQYIATTLDEWW